MQTRVFGHGFDGAGGGAAQQGALLERGEVHVVGRIDFQAVGGRNLAHGLDLLAELGFAQSRVAQGGGFDAVEGMAGERAVVQVGVIGAEGNAVGIELRGLALHINHGVGFRLDNQPLTALVEG